MMKCSKCSIETNDKQRYCKSCRLEYQRNYRKTYDRHAEYLRRKERNKQRKVKLNETM